jgi:mannose-6-phosphate isomerase-like protein (cupin superfamily)
MPQEKVFCMQLKGRQRFLRLLGDSSKIKGLRSGYVVLKPKESIGEHNTGLCEEVILVINGSGLVRYDEKFVLKVKKNSVIYIPPQMPHNVINTGKNLLKYIYTAARV